MAHKQLPFHSAAREKILRGASARADAGSTARALRSTTGADSAACRKAPRSSRGRTENREQEGDQHRCPTHVVCPRACPLKQISISSADEVQAVRVPLRGRETGRSSLDGEDYGMIAVNPNQGPSADTAVPPICFTLTSRTSPGTRFKAGMGFVSLKPWF